MLDKHSFNTTRVMKIDCFTFIKAFISLLECNGSWDFLFFGFETNESDDLLWLSKDMKYEETVELIDNFDDH